ncbi:MAG: NmrA family NAD(P)-binding protein [Myxococcaceae bacterium]
MAEPLFVIVGATGHTGSVIAQTLLEQRKRVRVIGRSLDRLKPFTDRGAEPAVGSVDDVAFLRRAFGGATALYAMIPPAQVDDFRAFQDKVVAAQGGAAEAAGITHVVILSSLGAELPEGTGPIVGLHRLEERFRGMPAVLSLRAAYFMENHLLSIPMIKQMGFMGGALKPELAVPHIATRDIGVVAARRLAALDFKGSPVVDVLGPRELSMNEIARTLGTAIGNPDLKYVQFSYEEAQKGLVQLGVRPKTAALYMENSKALNEGRVRPTQPESSTVRAPTTLEQFAKTFARAYQAA